MYKYISFQSRQANKVYVKFIIAPETYNYWENNIVPYKFDLKKTSTCFW